MGFTETKNRQSLERAIAEAANDVELRLAYVFEQPGDVEAMHKFRVSIRTLRGLVDFIKPFQSAKQNRRMQRNLRSVVVETSRLREIDVLSAQLVGEQEEAPLAEAAEDAPAQVIEESAEQQEAQADSSDTEKTTGASNDLGATCARMRRKELKRVLSALKSKKARRALKSAYADAHALEWKKGIVKKGITLDTVTARFDDLVNAQAERMAKLDPNDAERTHTVRKKAKQVRYAATKFNELLGDDALDVAKRMEDAQDDLGAICDARVNLKLLAAFPRKALSPDALQTLADAEASNAAFLESRVAQEDEAEQVEAEPVEVENSELDQPVSETVEAEQAEAVNDESDQVELVQDASEELEHAATEEAEPVQCEPQKDEAEQAEQTETADVETAEGEPAQDTAVQDEADLGEATQVEPAQNASE